MNRRQRDHRKLTDREMESKELNRSILPGFNKNFKKMASRKFGKRFKSSNKVMRYFYFIKRRTEC